MPNVVVYETLCDMYKRRSLQKRGYLQQAVVSCCSAEGRQQHLQSIDVTEMFSGNEGLIETFSKVSDEIPRFASKLGQ